MRSYTARRSSWSFFSCEHTSPDEGNLGSKHQFVSAAMPVGHRSCPLQARHGDAHLLEQDTWKCIKRATGTHRKLDRDRIDPEILERDKDKIAARDIDADIHRVEEGDGIASRTIRIMNAMEFLSMVGCSGMPARVKASSTTGRIVIDASPSTSGNSRQSASQAGLRRVKGCPGATTAPRCRSWLAITRKPGPEWKL